MMMAVMPYPIKMPIGTQICSRVSHIVFFVPPNLSIQMGQQTNRNTWQTPVMKRVPQAAYLCWKQTKHRREIYNTTNETTVSILELKCWYSLPANIPITEMPKYTILPNKPTSVSFMSQSMAISALQAGSMPWSRLMSILVSIMSRNIMEGGLPSSKLLRTSSCITG